MINILGVNISNLNRQKVLAEIERFLSGSKPRYVVTPNPEIILTAQTDEEFFYILNKADLALPDGVGLKFAGWTMSANLQRFTGADLVKEILRLAKEKKLKVAVLNWNGGLSKEDDIKNTLKKNFALNNYLVEGIGRKKKQTQQEIENLRNFSPDILFATLGAPYQEKLIYHILPKLPSIKLAVGVGGAFDFLTGTIKRAPRLIRFFGLEWLWRLWRQPWRRGRICRAVIVFPYKFFKWRFIYPFLYRPNVACLMYKQEKAKYQIFIVERKDNPGHWQLPQGGLDGQDIKTAGGRELNEEAGTDKFKYVAGYKNLHRYKFFLNSTEKYNYKGQKQGLFIARFYGQDSDIKIQYWEHRNWKWVAAEELVQSVHPCRQKATKIYLTYFNKIIAKKSYEV